MLSKDVELSLIRRAFAGEQSARDELLLSFQGMIHDEAIKLNAMYDTADIDELVNCANLCILENFGKFDPEKGVRPSTYYVRIGRNSMLQFANAYRTIKPPWVGRKLSSEKSLERARITRNVRSLNTDRINSWHNEKDGLFDGTNSERTRGGPVAVDLSYTVVDENVLPPDQAAQDAEAAELVRQAIQNLPGKFRKIIEWRMRGDDLNTIAKLLKCSPRSVRDKEFKAHDMIVEYFTDRRLLGRAMAAMRKVWAAEEEQSAEE